MRVAAQDSGGSDDDEQERSSFGGGEEEDDDDDAPQEESGLATPARVSKRKATTKRGAGSPGYGRECLSLHQQGHALTRVAALGEPALAARIGLVGSVA